MVMYIGEFEFRDANEALRRRGVEKEKVQLESYLAGKAHCICRLSASPSLAIRCLLAAPIERRTAANLRLRECLEQWGVLRSCQMAPHKAVRVSEWPSKDVARAVIEPCSVDKRPNAILEPYINGTWKVEFKPKAPVPFMYEAKFSRFTLLSAGAFCPEELSDAIDSGDSWRIMNCLSSLRRIGRLRLSESLLKTPHDEWDACQQIARVMAMSTPVRLFFEDFRILTSFSEGIQPFVAVLLDLGLCPALEELFVPRNSIYSPIETDSSDFLIAAETEMLLHLTRVDAVRTIADAIQAANTAFAMNVASAAQQRRDDNLVIHMASRLLMRFFVGRAFADCSLICSRSSLGGLDIWVVDLDVKGYTKVREWAEQYEKCVQQWSTLIRSATESRDDGGKTKVATMSQKPTSVDTHHDALEELMANGPIPLFQEANAFPRKIDRFDGDFWHHNPQRPAVVTQAVYRQAVESSEGEVKLVYDTYESMTEFPPLESPVQEIRGGAKGNRNLSTKLVTSLTTTTTGSGDAKATHIALRVNDLDCLNALDEFESIPDPPPPIDLLLNGTVRTTTSDGCCPSLHVVSALNLEDERWNDGWEATADDDNDKPTTGRQPPAGKRKAANKASSSGGDTTGPNNSLPPLATEPVTPSRTINAQRDAHHDRQPHQERTRDSRPPTDSSSAEGADLGPLTTSEEKFLDVKAANTPLQVRVTLGERADGKSAAECIYAAPPYRTIDEAVNDTSSSTEEARLDRPDEVQCEDDPSQGRENCAGQCKEEDFDRATGKSSVSYNQQKKDGSVWAGIQKRSALNRKVAPRWLSKKDERATDTIMATKPTAATTTLRGPKANTKPETKRKIDQVSMLAVSMKAAVARVAAASNHRPSNLEGSPWQSELSSELDTTTDSSRRDRRDGVPPTGDTSSVATSQTQILEAEDLSLPHSGTAEDAAQNDEEDEVDDADMESGDEDQNEEEEEPEEDEDERQACEEGTTDPQDADQHKVPKLDDPLPPFGSRWREQRSPIVHYRSGKRVTLGPLLERAHFDLSAGGDQCTLPPRSESSSTVTDRSPPGFTRKLSKHAVQPVKQKIRMHPSPPRVYHPSYRALLQEHGLAKSESPITPSSQSSPSCALSPRVETTAGVNQLSQPKYSQAVYPQYSAPQSITTDPAIYYVGHSAEEMNGTHRNVTSSRMDPNAKPFEQRYFKPFAHEQGFYNPTPPAPPPQPQGPRHRGPAYRRVQPTHHRLPPPPPPPLPPVMPVRARWEDDQTWSAFRAIWSIQAPQTWSVPHLEGDEQELALLRAGQRVLRF